MSRHMPGPGSENGIYVYNPKNSSWTLLRKDGDAFKIGELGEGTYVVYFDNLLCPACRIQDQHFYRLIVKRGSEDSAKFVIIMCNWFSGNCSSQAAAKSFEAFDVSASPTIIVAKVKDGNVKMERLEGVRTENIIEYYMKSLD